MGSTRRRRGCAGLALLALASICSLVAALPAAAAPGRQPAETVAGPAAVELLQRYAPVVVVREQTGECGDGEPYRPVPVDVVFGRDDVVLRGPDGAVVARAPDAGDLAGRGDGYYLDLPGDPLDPGCDYERWFRGMGEVPVAVNGRVATDPERPGRLVAQYWFWWVFNDWNDLHEGDWEMVQLQFAAGTPEEALATRPSSVAFAQHEGAEVSDWDDPKLLREGDHVAVYPSQGSHAAYYTQSQWFGKSASAGFGCDNSSIADGIDAVLLHPQVVVLTPQTPWLAYEGRWGEKAPAFNNGPTGPNRKTQWNSPVVWQEQGRPDAVAIPPVPGEAEDAFCALTAGASALFIDVLAHPILTLGALAIVLLVVVVVMRSTRWRGSSREPRAQRRAGQLLVAPVPLLLRHWRRYAGVVVALFAVLAAGTVAQSVLQGPAPGAGLTTVGALHLNAAIVIGILLAAVATTVGVAWCLSVATAVTAGLPDARASRLIAKRPTCRSAWRSLLSYVAILACAVTVLLLPLALYLIARWAVATPVAIDDDLPVGAAGRRSAELTAGRRWRALLVTLAGLLLATGTGSLAGAVLLLLTPLPFVAGNAVALAATAVAGTLLAISWTLHLRDLQVRAQAPSVPPGSAVI